MGNAQAAIDFVLYQDRIAAVKFSDAARPPIQEQEARTAVESLCPQHKGHLDPAWHTTGRVFFCPIGRMYWRVGGAWAQGMYVPLTYQHERPI